MRCPACGARNPDGAAWCSQCYTTLAAEPEERVDEPSRIEGGDPAQEGVPAAPEAGEEPAEPGIPAEGPTDAAPVQLGDVRRTAEGELEWRCGRCDAWNPIAEDRCTVCGGTFADTVRGHAPEEVIERDPTSVLVATVVLPGLGHAMLGRPGQAVARGATYVLWLTGGLVLLVGGRGSGVLLPALTLLLGALVLLVVSVHDVTVVQRGRGTELLTARAFLWLVVAVLAALLLSFVPAMFRLGSL